MQVMIFSLFIYGAISSVLVGENDFCTCSQLNQFDCGLLPMCEFSDGKCSDLPCNKIKSQVGCEVKKSCGWFNSTCSDFKSCSAYNITTEQDCDNLNHNCYFDEDKEACEEPQSWPYQCSQNPAGFCYIGTDGICYENGKACQQLTQCDSVYSGNLSCLLAFPACIPGNNETEKCKINTGCSNAQWSQCLIGSESINGKKAYICKEGAKADQCVDWDPSVETEKTCFDNSLGFYHWADSKCEKCSFSQLVYPIMLIIIALFI